MHSFSTFKCLCRFVVVVSDLAQPRAMLRRALTMPAVTAASLQIPATEAATQRRHKKFIRVPDAQWDPQHEDINAHVLVRVPGETRDERARRFARDWRNVETAVGAHKDARGRDLKWRKTYVQRYTFPNSWDVHWTPQR